jgi:hypothetical protein
MVEETMKSGKFYTSAILKSKGMEALSRQHAREFSVNILTMNANELLDGISIVENPKVMVKAFAEKNLGAASQMHKEIIRLVHNYLCAVSTLIDHNRKFMNKYTERSRFRLDYDSEIQRLFNTGEMARFVRDLRNYVTHKGLPDSKIGISLVPIQDVSGVESDGLAVPANISSSIKYKVANFLEWDGWSSPAKRYLCGLQDDDISFRDIFDQHIQLMSDFNDWFNKCFEEHHRADFDELKILQARYRELKNMEESLAPVANL